MSKRSRFTLAAIVALAGVAIGAWLLMRSEPPELVRELRALPEVASVKWRGPGDARLTVVHLRDWHFVPQDMANLEGIDFDENNIKVEKVQVDELAIARFLIKHYGVTGIYSEGLSAAGVPPYKLKIDVMRDVAKPANSGMIWLELGLPGRLYYSAEIKDVLPLEDAKALDAAGPKLDDDGKIYFDQQKVTARRKAMVANLPAEGLAVVVLGGSHDLGPHLGNDVLYIQVTPASYP